MSGGLDAVVRAAVNRRPDEPALADAPNRAHFFGGDPVVLSWAEVDHAVDSIAAGLQNHGVGEGDVVGVQLPNIVELPLVILACQRIGAGVTPFAVQYREHELRHGFHTAGVHLMVTADRPDREGWSTVVRGVAADHDVAVAELGADLTIDGGGAPAPVSVDDHATATICWTSGTTGTPKGVPRSHSMWMATSGVQVDELGLGPGDRILCPFPVVNMAGIGGMLVPWIETGSFLALHHPIDLPVFLGQITEHAITYTVAPPPLLTMLLRNDALLADVDLGSLRTITSGSAPLDPSMVAGWHDRGIEITNAFGSNEGAALLSTAASVPDPELRARFFPLPRREGVEVRIVDPDTGHVVEDADTPGELRFLGPTVFAGYLDSDGSEFDVDGYYRTGDIFEYVDTDHGDRLLRFIDRAKDIIIRGGMNISAAEVEGLLSTHAAVVESAVVGIPDAELGERVAVVVVAGDGPAPTVEALADHLRSLGVASYKHPESVTVVDELPRNPVGKVLKPQLREQLAELTRRST